MAIEPMIVPVKSQPTPEPQKADYLCMPVSEIARGDRRLEAQVYLSPGFLIRRTIRQSGLKAPTLAELARKIWQPSRLKGIQVDAQHGVPFVTATQVFDIWPRPRKWLAPARTPQLADRYVEPGWVLITCSGTVGTAIVTYSAHAELVVSHDLLRVEFNEPELRSYAYTFLRTRFGRAMMQSSHYGNVIKHLEVSHLGQVPVPILEERLDEIHTQIADVFAARDEAYRLDMAARDELSRAMRDQPDMEDDEWYSVRATRLFARRRRLEAYAHGPDSRFVARVYQRNATATVPLRSLARVFQPGRFKRIYGDVGISYLDSEPIFKINPRLTKILTPATAINPCDYLVQKGWLLMARSGQIYGLNGQAILANESHHGKVVTEHIIRIVPDTTKIRPGYLQTLFSHPTLGRPLVVSQAYGTSVPELAPEDIERLPVPRLSSAVENLIASGAERASQLRRVADELENKVVSSLEAELEKELAIGMSGSGRMTDRSH
jgi:hypothetical protein